MLFSLIPSLVTNEYPEHATPKSDLSFNGYRSIIANLSDPRNKTQIIATRSRIHVQFSVENLDISSHESIEVALETVILSVPVY